eukprot:1159054-Pelagomonas_calceolata.AAC.3
MAAPKLGAPLLMTSQGLNLSGPPLAQCRGGNVDHAPMWLRQSWAHHSLWPHRASTKADLLELTVEELVVAAR